MKSIEISIIVPCLNEDKYISDCIKSIVNSDYEKSKMEVLFIDGGSSDNTKDIIKMYQKNYSYIRLLKNSKRIVPVAMNIGIKEAKGEYIIRLDAHSFYPKDYFSKLITYHKKLNASNIGGIVITDVKNKTLKSNSIKKILSHPLGVGNSDFRVGVEDIKEVDTVPFGCYHKGIFKKFGLYDEQLIRNQDIELNKRIINGGGKIYLVPNIQCIYYARETFTALAKNNYSNGYWNILTAYYTKTLNSLSLRHFIPLLFILSLLLPIVLSLFIPKIGWLSLLSLSSYLALVIIISLKLRKEENSFWALIGSFLTLHLSYGWGSLMGMFSLMKKVLKGEK